MQNSHGLLPSHVDDDTAAVAQARDLARLLAVLADPSRLGILTHLRGGEHQVGELATHLGLAQSTVSQHLEVLRSTGLVSTHSHGRARVSRLEHEPCLTALLAAAQDLQQAASPATTPDHPEGGLR